MKKKRDWLHTSSGKYNFYCMDGKVNSNKVVLEQISAGWANGSQIYAECSVVGGEIHRIELRTLQGYLRFRKDMDIFGNLRFGNVTREWKEIRRDLKTGKIPAAWENIVMQELEKLHLQYLKGKVDEFIFLKTYGEGA